jgi:hypothetical protein
MQILMSKSLKSRSGKSRSGKSRSGKSRSGKSRSGMRKRNSDFSNKKKHRTYRRKGMRGGDEDEDREMESQKKYTTTTEAETSSKILKETNIVKSKIESIQESVEKAKKLADEVLEMTKVAKTDEDWEEIKKKRAVIDDIFKTIISS